MTNWYRVVGHCAHATVETGQGPMVRMFYRGELVPGTAPQIGHLLSVGLIEPVGDAGGPPPPASPPPSPAGKAADPAGDVDPAEDAKRAAARAKLPADGSQPDARAGQAVWVEWLVGKGYDYAALAKEDKKALMELASQL